MDADGSNEIQLTTQQKLGKFGFQQAWFPRFSPDGSKILFYATNSSDFESAIFIMNPNGADIQQYTAKEVNAFQADWSSEGAMIIFSTNRTEHPKKANFSNLYLALAPDNNFSPPITLNDAIPLTAEIGGDNWGGKLSPDGTKIAWNHETCSPYAACTFRTDIFVSNLDGSDSNNLTPNGTQFLDGLPDWGPAP
jgi:Tol biopolymer transport system component